MLLHHVLAVVDFSVPGLHAAWRAARLAWAHDADLRLVALVAASDRRPASRFGPSAPPVRAHSDLSFLAEEIVHTLGVRTAVSVGAGGDAWEALCIQARMADLAVLPDATARLRMNGWWHSGLAEQLLRTTGVPVLVARRPSGVVHRRALVAADPDSKAVPALLQAARWFCGEEGIRACHVMGPEVERHLHAADLPLPAINAWLETAGARARAALSRQLIQDQFIHDFAPGEALDHAAVLAWLGSEKGIVAAAHAQRSVARLRVRPAADAGFHLVGLIDRVESALGTPVQTAVSARTNKPSPK